MLNTDIIKKMVDVVSECGWGDYHSGVSCDVVTNRPDILMITAHGMMSDDPSGTFEIQVTGICLNTANNSPTVSLTEFADIFSSAFSDKLNYIPEQDDDGGPGASIDFDHATPNQFSFAWDNGQGRGDTFFITLSDIKEIKY